MKQQGVTLIQMMFALTITAGLTHLGMPAYLNFSDDLHRSATARELAQALRTARSHALLQQRSVLVEPLEGDWGTGWRTVLEDNQQLLREHRLVRPMTTMSSTARKVRFSAQGIPQTSTANLLGITLEVCKRFADQPYRQVVMATSGRVRLDTEKPKTSMCPAI